MGQIVVFRHGQSMANVAFAEAQKLDKDLIELEGCDSDAVLSPEGREQSIQLARWLKGSGLLPQEIYCSPYARARATCAAVVAGSGAGDGVRVRLDERARDRDLGILARRTPASVERNFASEAARSREAGEFYYRPPGGESFADVALRVRSLVREINIDRCTLVVTHEPVVAMFAYLLEEMSDSRLDDLMPVANASVSRWTWSDTGEVGRIEYNSVITGA